MRKNLIFFFLCISSLVMAQQDEDKAAVRATVDAFFEAFHKGDTIALQKTLGKKLVLQTAYKDKKGNDVLRSETKAQLITAIGTRPTDQKWDEKLLDYSIQVDGNMANVWTPYEFYFNGSFSHCGVNSFQLFRKNGVWKIIYLIDTRRRLGCK